MQRALWKGAISFGLVNIAVELFPAEQNYSLHFKLLDKRNHKRIRYARINEDTQKEVPWKDIVKAYEYEGDYIELTDQEFKDLSVKNFKSMDIEHFIDVAELSPLYYEKPYYLIPDKNSVKAYVLLRETLKNNRKIGISKLIIHNRQHLVAIMSCGNALLVETLRYPQQLRDRSSYNFPSEELETYRIHPQELEMAEQLVNSMGARWKPQDYEDETHELLLNWIHEKARKTGRKKAEKPTSKSRTKAKEVINMMDLLKKSIAKKRPTQARKVTKRAKAK